MSICVYVYICLYVLCGRFWLVILSFCVYVVSCCLCLLCVSNILFYLCQSYSTPPRKTHSDRSKARLERIGEEKCICNDLRFWHRFYFTITCAQKKFILSCQSCEFVLQKNIKCLNSSSTGFMLAEPWQDTAVVALPTALTRTTCPWWKLRVWKAKKKHSSTVANVLLTSTRYICIDILRYTVWLSVHCTYFHPPITKLVRRDEAWNSLLVMNVQALLSVEIVVKRETRVTNTFLSLVSAVASF